MRLTTKGRYAVTAMLDLAIHREEGPITLADISHRQGISLSYLEQLFSKLRKKSLVDSTRGPGGGYRLSRDTRDISIADIIAAVDEKVDAMQCNGMKNCNDDSVCLTHQLWSDLSEQLRQFLKGISLEQMVSNRPQEVSKEIAMRKESSVRKIEHRLAR